MIARTVSIAKALSWGETLPHNAKQLNRVCPQHPNNQNPHH